MDLIARNTSYSGYEVVGWLIELCTCQMGLD